MVRACAAHSFRQRSVPVGLESLCAAPSICIGRAPAPGQPRCPYSELLTPAQGTRTPGDGAGTGSSRYQPCSPHSNQAPTYRKPNPAAHQPSPSAWKPFLAYILYTYQSGGSVHSTRQGRPAARQKSTHSPSARGLLQSISVAFPGLRFYSSRGRSNTRNGQRSLRAARVANVSGC